MDRSGEMLRQAKENAENNGVTVEFYQVGEELPFREASFDLVLSRDVTWMQLHPEDVLSRWFDLVRPGGRMLYFDANWYGYLRTKDTFRQYQAHRKYVRSSHGFIYEKAREMERMALEFPLTYQVRPAWDEKFWKTKDVSRVYSMTELNSRIYSQMEQIQYAKTPEFLVVVEK